MPGPGSESGWVGKQGEGKGDREREILVGKPGKGISFEMEMKKISNLKQKINKYSTKNQIHIMEEISQQGIWICLFVCLFVCFRRVYWLVLCQLDTAGVITEKGASVEEMTP
jgi:penicillin-binding protein-related factor A (putative recombinase)